ncbi:hypothetical protein [Streptomyces sp. H27-D2]|uniref:hypothetical protein n=1 Tax=Streptomyces sp. H27-D2 TaxID=3046304 RepID=UPI002DBAEDD5|nr:hypothetical protein [Streptomyces sp. H27-D2]MEC4019787.1 hypothetical protein [Streptomyces sp. H27-D2]
MPTSPAAEDRTCPSPPAPPERGGRRWDLLAAVGAVCFVAVVAVVGTAVEKADGTLYVDWPPLYADWLPHVGPGTPAAVVVALAVVVYGPGLAGRVPWRGVVLGGWAAGMAWTWALALVDGWYRGVAERLTAEHEYLRAVDRFGDIGAALRGYTEHILLTQPDHWPAHVSGHPPAAVLTFVGLDRIGLDGGGWAGAWCITVGSSAVAAVLVALRAVAGESSARRAAPFLVLAPAAIWVGASADGYFAAVAAWGLALLALAATRKVRFRAVTALGSGLLLGLGCYLSYGLTLIAVPALAVLLIARTARPLPLVLTGVAVVGGLFTVAGFQWWEAYGLLVERYYQGVGADRPFSYWVWGNLANAVIVTGLATVAGVRRAVSAGPGALRRFRTGAVPTGAFRTGAVRTGAVPTGTVRTGAAGPSDGLVVLVLAALATIVIADLSGMSKAETERIWLPFTLWLLPAAALLPARDARRWLLAQAAVALLINHLLLTGW